MVFSSPFIALAWRGVALTFRSAEAQSFIVCCTLIFLQGCSLGQQEPLYQQLSETPGQPLCRLVVLPFANHTESSQAGAVVTKIFASSLQRAGYSVALEGNVRQLYQQLRIRIDDEVTQEHYRIIAAQLQADALVIGKVVEFQENVEKGRLDPTVAFEVGLMETGSQRRLFTTYFKKTGKNYRKVLHFGLINTLFRLTRIMSDDVIEQWINKGLHTCAPS